MLQHLILKIIYQNSSYVSKFLMVTPPILNELTIYNFTRTQSNSLCVCTTVLGIFMHLIWIHRCHEAQ